MKTQFISIQLIILYILTSCVPKVGSSKKGTQFVITREPIKGDDKESITNEDNSIFLTYSITNPDNSKRLSFSISKQPKKGILSNCKFPTNLKWECLYTPNKNFYGTDSISFLTKDGDFEAKDTSSLAIIIKSVEDKSLAGNDQQFTLVENTKIDFKVREGTDADTQKDKIIYTIIQPPTKGILSNCLQASNFLDCTYTPNPEYYGTDSLVYRVADHNEASTTLANTATVNFNITKEYIPVTGEKIIDISKKNSNVLIIFAVDTSESMVNYIAHMKKTILDFVDQVAARGFKATLAVIDSNARFKSVNNTVQPHPEFVNNSGSKIITTDYISDSRFVKKFEINAYDMAWNPATVSIIKAKKIQISNYLNGLTIGNPDERLLCSTTRFLHSDYVIGMNYVGLFTLANEDDAVVSKTAIKAFNSCPDKKVKTYRPKDKCFAPCLYDDINCNGKWTYRWTQSYVSSISARAEGNCTSTRNTLGPQTRAKGYKLVENKTNTSVEVCKLSYQTPDNSKGCKMEVKSILNGTFSQVSLDRVGTCQTHSDILGCTTYIKQNAVITGTESYIKSCKKYGTCSSRPEIMQCNNIPAISVNRTRRKTTYLSSPNKKSCLDFTGTNTCSSITWSGTKSSVSSSQCGITSSTKTHYYQAPSAGKQSLANSIANRLNDKAIFNKSVYIGVAHDEVLNTIALNKASTQNLTLPSIDCKSYLKLKEKYPVGIDGTQFKALSNFMGDAGMLFSICSPDRYPSSQLDLLVEDAQLGFEVPEYMEIDAFKVEKITLTYASGTTSILLLEDYSFNAGKLILLKPSMAKNLVKLTIKYSGLKK